MVFVLNRCTRNRFTRNPAPNVITIKKASYQNRFLLPILLPPDLHESIIAFFPVKCICFRAARWASAIKKQQNFFIFPDQPSFLFAPWRRLSPSRALSAFCIKICFFLLLPCACCTYLCYFSMIKTCIYCNFNRYFIKKSLDLDG